MAVVIKVIYGPFQGSQKLRVGSWYKKVYAGVRKMKLGMWTRKRLKNT